MLKHHWKSHQLYLAIAQIAIGFPPPCANRDYGPLFLKLSWSKLANHRFDSTSHMYIRAVVLQSILARLNTLLNTSKCHDHLTRKSSRQVLSEFLTDESSLALCEQVVSDWWWYLLVGSGRWVLISHWVVPKNLNPVAADQLAANTSQQWTAASAVSLFWQFSWVALFLWKFSCVAFWYGNSHDWHFSGSSCGSQFHLFIFWNSNRIRKGIIVVLETMQHLFMIHCLHQHCDCQNQQEEI